MLSIRSTGEVTGVHVGTQVIHPTLPTHNTDRGISAVIRPTVMELGLYNQQIWGGIDRGA